MNNSPICYIVGAGDFCERLTPRAYDTVIAADGGYDALVRIGVRPDLLIGDLDSLGYVPKDVEILRYPVEKDETDTALAYLVGYERGYRNFEVFGGTGGRIDHTIANYCLLLRAKLNGAEMTLTGDGTRARVIMGGESLTLHGKEGASVSLFAFGGEAEGVTIEGLKYTVQGVTISPEIPLGVSNSHTAKGEGRISLLGGALLVIEEI